MNQHGGSGRHVLEGILDRSCGNRRQETVCVYGMEGVKVPVTGEPLENTYTIGLNAMALLVGRQADRY